MDEPQYEIFDDGDGTFTVIVYGVDGAEIAVKFGSREEADEWVREQRRKLGIEKGWSETPD